MTEHEWMMLFFGELVALAMMVAFGIWMLRQ